MGLVDGGGSYSFRGRWVVEAPRAQVHAVLVDLEHYPEWWPQVLAVAKVTDDDARVLCRSALPYTLDLMLHAVRRDLDVLETSLAGDLHGSVRWRLTEQDGSTRLDFEQDVDVGSRWLRLASVVVRPLLRWNHDRMMVGCLDGLRARLAA
ncbi:SRPBCC family protein [Nocardioides sp. GCM10027113]|uniref:SRPBCC family protein n=1 Tax=unclassified Nocardioides TaxID=2615069 RepID=UPI00360F3C43